MLKISALIEYCINFRFRNDSNGIQQILPTQNDNAISDSTCTLKTVSFYIKYIFEISIIHNSLKYGYFKNYIHPNCSVYIDRNVAIGNKTIRPILIRKQKYVNYFIVMAFARWQRIELPSERMPRLFSIAWDDNRLKIHIGNWWKIPAYVRTMERMKSEIKFEKTKTISTKSPFLG